MSVVFPFLFVRGFFFLISPSGKLEKKDTAKEPPSDEKNSTEGGINTCLTDGSLGKPTNEIQGSERNLWFSKLLLRLF